MDPLFWAIGLLAIGLCLVVLEMFVPSGGLIGVLAVIAVIGSVVMAFMRGPVTGLTFMVLGVVALPAAFGMAVKVWPHTPLGRRILAPNPTSEEVLPEGPKRRDMHELVGKVGRAKTLMLPSGAAEFDGRVVDALSDGMAIEAGQLVRVIDVRGNRVLVRPASDEEATQSGNDDILSQPIDAIGLNPFEDPIV